MFRTAKLYHKGIMVKRRKMWRARAPRPMSVTQEMPALLARMGGSPLRAKLASLWANWASVLGPELAELALPLKAHGDTLILGAEDAMTMQELHFLTGDILEQINAFLQFNAFTQVKVLLAKEGRNFPQAKKSAPPATPTSEHAHSRQPLSGKFLKQMDPTSPLARCYARFVQQRDHSGS